MLQFFFRLANRLKPFRRFIVVMTLGFSLLAVYGFIRSGVTPSAALQAGLSGTLFSALLLATIDIFHSVPPPAAPGAHWFARFRRHSVRFFYAVVALLVLISGLMLVSTSFKLFSL